MDGCGGGGDFGGKISQLIFICSGLECNYCILFVDSGCALVMTTFDSKAFLGLGVGRGKTFSVFIRWGCSFSWDADASSGIFLIAAVFFLSRIKGVLEAGRRVLLLGRVFGKLVWNRVAFFTWTAALVGILTQDTVRRRFKL